MAHPPDSILSDAVFRSLLLSGYENDLSDYCMESTVLQWTLAAVAALEPSLADQVAEIMDRLATDLDSAARRFTGALLKAEEAAGQEDPTVLLKKCKSLGRIGDDMERAISARMDETDAFLRSVMAASGKRIPQLPPRLIRPRPVLDALKRLIAGYASEKLER